MYVLMKIIEFAYNVPKLSGQVQELAKLQHRLLHPPTEIHT